MLCFTCFIVFHVHEILCHFKICLALEKFHIPRLMLIFSEILSDVWRIFLSREVTQPVHSQHECTPNIQFIENGVVYFQMPLAALLCMPCSKDSWHLLTALTTQFINESVAASVLPDLALLLALGVQSMFELWQELLREIFSLDQRLKSTEAF